MQGVALGASTREHWEGGIVCSSSVHLNINGSDDLERLDCPFILIILKAAMAESKQGNCSLSMQSPCILGGFLIIIKCLIK